MGILMYIFYINIFNFSLILNLSFELMGIVVSKDYGLKFLLRSVFVIFGSLTLNSIFHFFQIPVSELKEFEVLNGE
jgi:hypothetical protein